MAAVVFTERGQERLNEQDSETTERIKKKLREICDWPDHFLKPLKGRNDYVLRVGDYRVLIDWRKNDGETGDSPSHSRTLDTASFSGLCFSLVVIGSVSPPSWNSRQGVAAPLRRR